MGSDISSPSIDFPDHSHFTHSFDVSAHAYKGDNYDPDGNGAYNVGYEQGYEDSVHGHTSDDSIDYVVACTEDGNQGYVDGVADGGNFGNDK
jgi:hypothetical protein